MYVALVLFMPYLRFIFFSASFRELGPLDLCHVAKSSGCQVVWRYLNRFAICDKALIYLFFSFCSLARITTFLE
jgi:hypothetical protein